MPGLAPNAANGSIEAIVQVLNHSIESGGTTFSDYRDIYGVNGNYGGVAWVYDREEEPCRVCGTPIRRLKLAGALSPLLSCFARRNSEVFSRQRSRGAGDRVGKCLILCLSQSFSIQNPAAVGGEH